MEHGDFTGAIKERLGEQFNGANVTIIAGNESYDEKAEMDSNGKIVAVEFKAKTLKHPKLYVYVDDTSKPQSDGFYPVVGIMVRNPKITERNAKYLSTRCGNALRRYFNEGGE